MKIVLEATLAEGRAGLLDAALTTPWEIDTWYDYPKRGEARTSPSRLPFHELDNVVMTPHAASWTEGLLPRRYRFIAANLDRLARREALENMISP